MKNKVYLFLLSIILFVSCETKKNETIFREAIRINQVGFYPNAVKQFVVADLEASFFEILDENNKNVFEYDRKIDLISSKHHGGFDNTYSVRLAFSSLQKVFASVIE